MEHLNELLKAAGITRAAVARAAGVTPAAVSFALKRKSGVGYYAALRLLSESKNKLISTRDIIDQFLMSP